MSFHERGLYARRRAAATRGRNRSSLRDGVCQAGVVHSNLRMVDKRNEYGKRALDLIDRLTTRERYYIEGLHFPHPKRSGEPSTATRRACRCIPSTMRCATISEPVQPLELFPEAIEQFEELIRRGTTLATSHGNLAGAYAFKGETRRGREIPETYLRGSGKRHRNAVSGRTVALEGRWDEARATHQKSLALNAASLQPRAVLWSLAVLQHDWPEAVAIGRQLASAATRSSRSRAS